MVTLNIDEIEITVPEGTTILDAAQQESIYIPRICSHPDLPPVDILKPAEAIYRYSKRLENKKFDLLYEGCQLCMVQIEGKESLDRACCTEVAEGMIIHTNTPDILEFRRERLMLLLAKHPHACLTCAQKEGCARFPCSMNIPENERCCPQFGNCEFQKVAEYIGIKQETPRYVFESLPVDKDEPLFERNYHLCIGCTRCIRVCRDVRGIEAIDFVFDDESRIIVGTGNPTLRESACRFCTACVEVCPTGALIDKKPFNEIPCHAACPAGIDVPRYVNHIAQGKFDEAIAVIREKVPFPGVLGCVCTHPCEAECRRGELNEPISIRALKYFVAKNERGAWKKDAKVAKPTGKKVAVIGSGPAGLTAAYYLAKQGHGVTVFEKLPVTGGMLRVGIPEYRLPRDILKGEIHYIEKLGVEIKTGVRIGETITLKELQDSYQVVFIATGAHNSVKQNIEGEDVSGVINAVDFLFSFNMDNKVEIGKRVVVIGGGNTAIDASRVAKRLNAASVTILYRRSHQEMPVVTDEVEAAEEENIEIMFQVAPTRIVSRDGKVTGVECVRMNLDEPDSSGRRRPVPIGGSEFVIDADTVIQALGQVPDLEFIEQAGFEVTEKGTISVDKATLATNIEDIFAGGDATTGPASVIEAIAAGRRAATSIDLYLGGSGDIDESLLPPEEPDHWLGREEGFADLARIRSPYQFLPPQFAGLSGAEPPLSQEAAIIEAKRCLRCDLRLLFSKPILPPGKELWTVFTTENISEVPEVEGVYQLIDEQKNIIYIKGAMNLHRELADQLELNENARYFMYKEEPMYTKKESELLQQFIAVHGEMPEGNRELDDLF